MRQSRKYEHLKYALQLEDGPLNNCFRDFSLIHNCLPDMHSTQVDLLTGLAGIRLEHPIVINAITGGADNVTEINRQLAEVARTTHSAMAVGSQYAGLEQPETVNSYKIVRKLNPSGVLFANLGAHVNVDQAAAAVDMIEAQALQLHLNAAQEIMMAEGERDFTGYLKNMERIVRKVTVPVIVKEVGCGIAAEQARLFADIGVKAVDIGGAGGTNFIAIEAARLDRTIPEDVLEWGIPTAISAVEVMNALPASVDTVVTGGIRTPLETVKALTLGAVAVGIASPLLKLMKQGGSDKVVNWLNEFLHNVKILMLLTGAANLQELKKKPVVITGYSREWLIARGIDPTLYSLREKHG